MSWESGTRSYIETCERFGKLADKARACPHFARVSPYFGGDFIS